MNGTPIVRGERTWQGKMEKEDDGFVGKGDGIGNIFRSNRRNSFGL
jgi:hypothetical protein